MRRTAGRVITLIVGVLSITVLAGVVWASIPAPDGVIHGCYKTSNPATGSVIVIDSGASCPSGFTALNWNQTGPAGSPGPGLQRILSTQHLSPNQIGGYSFDGSVECPTGLQAINGGLWERSAAQAWVDAVSNDPNYPDVFASAGTGNFLSIATSNGSDVLDQNPSRMTNDVTADGAGWRFLFSGQAPSWAPNGATPPTYYAVDVTFWVACVQPDS
jgi:hypothetical protein